MAKCTETCPKCGSKSIYDEPYVNGKYVANYWECGSKEINGTFRQWGDCLERELRRQLAAANAEIERLRAEASRARKSLDVMRRGTCNLAAAEAYAHALEITREIVHREYHPHD